MGVILVAPVRGQDAATVTLEDALRLARAGNPAIHQAANRSEIAIAAERSGWGAFLPRLRTSASLSEFSSRTLTARNEFGQPVTLDDPATISATAASGGLSASLVLLDGFRRVNELQAARAGTRAADAFERAEVVRIEAEVRRRFYAALTAQRLIEAEERLLDAAGQRLDAMREMVRAGRATPQDVLGAEVDLARQEMALEAARADAQDRRLALREVMGVDMPVRFRVAGSFPEPADPASLDADALVARALDASPRLRRATAEADAAQHRADAARSERWPRIELRAGLDRAITLPNADQLTQFPWNRGVGAAVSVELPVFSGFAASERIARAEAASSDAAQERRRTRLAVERQVRTALNDVDRAYGAVRLARRAAELSRRRLEIAQEGFRRGVVSFTELQQLIDRAAFAERTAVRARREYADARIGLDEAVGGRVAITGAGEGG